VSQSDLASLLVRYDIEHGLDEALESAERQASDIVLQAWTHPGSSAYQEALLGDVARVYADARAQLVAAVTEAYNSVPPAVFVPGVTTPGTNPAADVAHQRSSAVRQAVIDFSQGLALRNQLTVFTAGKGSEAAAVLAEAQLRHDAGEDVELRWVASMDGKDPRSCGWCKALNGVQVGPGEQFPHPGMLGKRKPPKLYLGTLYSPPLHPRCRCKLVIVTGEKVTSPSAPKSAAPSEAGGFISSETIRNMPEEQYEKLHHFLRSALHELGQVIQRLLHPNG
jgi:hypothetical protein